MPYTKLHQVQLLRWWIGRRRTYITPTGVKPWLVLSLFLSSFFLSLLLLNIYFYYFCPNANFLFSFCIYFSFFGGSKYVWTSQGRRCNILFTNPVGIISSVQVSFILFPGLSLVKRRGISFFFVFFCAPGPAIIIKEKKEITPVSRAEISAVQSTPVQPQQERSGKRILFTERCIFLRECD